MGFRHQGVFSRYAHTYIHTHTHPSVFLYQGLCTNAVLFKELVAIFRLNCRKCVAFINGQEAQNHSTWEYTNVKASLAFSQ